MYIPKHTPSYDFYDYCCEADSAEESSATPDSLFVATGRLMASVPSIDDHLSMVADDLKSGITKGQVQDRVSGRVGAVTKIVESSVTETLLREHRPFYVRFDDGIIPRGDWYSSKALLPARVKVDANTKVSAAYFVDYTGCVAFSFSAA